MRDSAFDVMKGIAIIAMVLGHAHIPALASDFIFVWHMPLFFIVSGFFYKPYPIILYIKKNIRLLLLPYFLTSIIIIGLTCLKDVIFNERNTIIRVYAAILGNGTPNNVNFQQYVIGAIWFLLALFWCRIIFNILYQKCSQPWIFFVNVLGISILATFCGTLLYIPADILQGLQGMFFFGVGYAFKTKKAFNYKIGMWGTFLILLFVLLSIWSGSLSMARCFYGYWPLNVFAAIGMTLVIYKLSKYLCSKNILGNRLLAFWGRISIVVLCVHILDIFFFPLKSFHNLFALSKHIDIFVHLFVALFVSSVIVKFTFVRKVFSIK